MPAPDKIKQLVETFEQNLKEYQTRKNETELRRQFLDPFFEALGWDVSNNKGNDERRKEVAHELSVEIDGQQKKADYAFRTGVDKFDFLVEAKKPSVKIESNPEPAFQVKRYGWSAKLPINILTDFEHFAVYDCRVKPNYKDKVTAGRTHLFHYKEYIEKWDEIAALFSPDAIRAGALEEFTEGLKTKKGTADVDDDFLAEIERWRDLLARNIANRNKDKGLTESQLNYAVQMTIDRIVFLRIAEERGMEEYGRLKDLCDPHRPSGTSPKSAGEKTLKPKGSADLGEDGRGSEGSIYTELKQYFVKADERYNSGLFHFKAEKGRKNPDIVTSNLQIDDKVLRDIIENLYEPKSPYAFAYIPADILGSVYERFLGKVIRLTAGGGAKVEDKPEVRKAGGVYYTPVYIVEYIVKNTVGKLTEGKTPKEVSEIKVVDPACGSGSFLLGAYQYVLNWHLDWYTQNDPEKHVKNKVLLTQDNKTYRLSMNEKKRILLNNIHGVDVDPQAVEVTKLSLLLKVVEDPGQLTMFAEGHILPDLGNNIKCGNSLIGMDYFEGQLMADPAETARVNPFDWQSEFPAVFKRGGFDAVIGNPPYGAIFNDTAKSYIKSHFQTYKYKYDSYIYFIEKAINISKHKGHISFITPELWLKLESSDLLREFIAKNADLDKLLICGENVFEDATVNTIVFSLRRGIESESVEIEVKQSSWKMPSKLWKSAKGFVIDYRVNPEISSIIEKIKTLPSLSDFGEAIQGITPYDKYRGQNPELIKRRGYHSDHKIDKTYEKWLSGKDVSRYKLSWSGEWLSYGSWLGAPRDPRFFTGTRLLFREVPGVGKRIQATIANEEVLYHGHSVTPFKLFENTSVKVLYVLAIVNSRLISWFGGKTLPNFGKEVFPKLNPQDILAIPIRPINFSNPAEKAKHDQMVTLVERMLALHKNLASAKTPQEKESVQRQIESTDGRIDSLVYELYGLSEEEIGIVEGRV